jgi:hypothetical protein
MMKSRRSVCDRHPLRTLALAGSCLGLNVSMGIAADAHSSISFTATTQYPSGIMGSPVEGPTLADVVVNGYYSDHRQLQAGFVDLQYGVAGLAEAHSWAAPNGLNSGFSLTNDLQQTLGSIFGRVRMDNGSFGGFGGDPSVETPSSVGMAIDLRRGAITIPLSQPEVEVDFWSYVSWDFSWKTFLGPLHKRTGSVAIDVQWYVPRTTDPEVTILRTGDALTDTTVNWAALQNAIALDLRDGVLDQDHPIFNWSESNIPDLRTSSDPQFYGSIGGHFTAETRALIIPTPWTLSIGAFVLANGATRRQRSRSTATSRD